MQKTLCQTHIVQRTWDKDQTLAVQGFIYSIHDGWLKNLNLTVTSKDQLKPFDRFDSESVLGA